MVYRLTQILLSTFFPLLKSAFNGDGLCVKSSESKQITPFSREFFPELVDLVLDHLHDDKATLRACSVVCKAWLGSCRFHLFHEVHVPYFTPTSRGRFIPFADFLYNTSSIRGVIHKLTLKADNIAYQPNANYYKGTAIIGPYLLVSICNMLPNLQNLRLLMLDWRREETYGNHAWGVNSNKNQLPPTIRPLQVLSISVIYTSGILQAPAGTNDGLRNIDILRYFTDVKLLRMTRLVKTADIPDMHPLHVEDLSLHYIADMSSWLELFRRAGIANHLRSLGVGIDTLCSSWQNRTLLSDWLQDVGPRLEHLRIDVVGISHAVDELMSRDWETFGLNTCVNVQSLTFIFPLLAKERITPFWDLLLYIASNIPCQDLRRLRIIFKGKGMNDNTDSYMGAQEAESLIQSLDWEGLSTLLPRFRYVQQPTLTLSYHDTYWHSKLPQSPRLQRVFDSILAQWFTL